MLFVFSISGHPQPVDGYRDYSGNDPRGDREPEVGSETEESSSNSQAGQGQVERRVEGAIEMGSDAGIDVLVEVDLVLVDFTDFLLALEEVEGEKFGIVVLGVGE